MNSSKRSLSRSSSNRAIIDDIDSEVAVDVDVDVDVAVIRDGVDDEIQVVSGDC